MSVINQIKGFVMINLKDEVPTEVRKKFTELLVELDNDLDLGYEPGDLVVEAIEQFDKALININEDTDNTNSGDNIEEPPEADRDTLLEGVGERASKVESEDDD